jgi:hypothetical protein
LSLGGTFSGGRYQTSGTGSITYGVATFSGNASLAGNVYAIQRSNFMLAGDISNSGTITLAPPSDYARMQSVGGSGTITLSGGGTIVLDSTLAPAYLWGSGTLVSNNSITGAGTFYHGGTVTTGGGSSSLQFSNGGLVSANVAGKSLYATPFRNAGTLQAVNGATLVMIEPLTIANSTGTLKALNGSTISLNGVLGITGGTLSTSGTGVIDIAAPALTTTFTAPMQLAGTIRVESGGTLALQGISFSAAGSTLQISNGATLTTGSNTTVSGSPTVELNGTWSTSGSKVTLGAVVGAGTLITNSPISVQHLRIGLLDLTHATVDISAGGGTLGTSALQALPTITGNSKLDVNDHDLVLDYVPASPITLDTVRTTLAGGYAGGAWNGTGIVSTSAKSSPASSRTALGYRISTDVVGAAGGTFSGVDIDDSAILIQYTLAGDANLDGAVNVADLAALAGSWQQPGYWTDGDFNYDGTVDAADLGALALNWQNGGAGAPALDVLSAAFSLPPMPIPEPACLGPLCVALFVLPRRRRRS